MGMKWNFFIFYIIFFQFVKNICRIFFAKISSWRQFIPQNIVSAGWTGGKLDGPWANKLTAGSSGGSYLLPDELAEGATAELQPTIAVL